MMFTKIHRPTWAALVFTTAALGVFTTAALGADASATRPEGAQGAEPAVSGEDLQNLNRDDRGADRTATPAEQPSPAAGREPQAARASSVRTDRLELDATAITGNRELPKVLYIVPWKKADIGELPAQPFNTLLDEALAPVDRDVFRREVTYFDAVSSGADANQSTSAQPR